MEQLSFLDPVDKSVSGATWWAGNDQCRNWHGYYQTREDGAGPWQFVVYAWILKGRCDGFRYLSLFSSSLKASVGVLHPRHFLGVPFKRSQIDFISRFESAATGASLGR